MKTALEENQSLMQNAPHKSEKESNSKDEFLANNIIGSSYDK